jgi:nucleotide-binding universal stress UspA family protein
MKILAATDGSRPARAAIRCAAWLASTLPRARLDIVLVGDEKKSLLQSPDRGSHVARTMKDEYRRWAQTALAAGAREAAAFRVPAHRHYARARRLEPVADVIARAASSLGTDVLVVGTHGRGAVGRGLLGSVARRLISIARVPVLVVPPPFSRPPRGSLRIVAASDGSRASTKAIRVAAGLVRRAHGELEIVTVSTLRQDLALGFTSPVLSFVPRADLARGESRAARRILVAGVRVARSAGVRPAVRFIEPRKAEPLAHVLAGSTRRAHLLAVGREGRSALEDWLLGSVTRRVLSVSRRPVLVVGAGRRG